ncbi:MAG: phosphonate C-P lyase system protein PhnH [Hyphomicrobium aestuarii]|nr:phosphonate C-P lyase system protein PhnH [Hyphomicrobium aestuarii]
MIAIHTGFSDTIHEPQAVFRALLDAMSRPGLVVALPAAPGACPLPKAMAATILTLADHETTIWLDPGLAARPEVASYLRFATAAKITPDPHTATFALVCDPLTMPSLDAFAQGTPDYPDRSTTILLAVDCLDSTAANNRDGQPEATLILTGPGIDGTAALDFTPQPSQLRQQLTQNRSRFPMGVDLIICASDTIAALPRSARIQGGA